ncbi:MAG: DHH family phosphoesterase, partial [Candidatus Micrarchaeota archaeon]
MERIAIADLAEGVDCQIAGKIIRTYEARGSFFLVLLDDSGKVCVRSNCPMNVGSLVTAKGKAERREEALEFVASSVEPMTEAQSEFSKAVGAFIETRTRPVESQMLIQDGVMKSLYHLILDCASRLLRARFLERPIVLRYHADADGISGAMCIARAVGICGLFATQNPHTVYEVQDAIRDLNAVRSTGESTLGPVLVLVDSGSGEDSADAVSLLKGAGLEIIIIDHHPLGGAVSETADCIVSPMLVGATSYYTAGLLAGEVARAVGGPDPESLQRISLAGDKS